MKKKNILKKMVVLALAACLSVGTAAAPATVSAASVSQKKLDSKADEVIKKAKVKNSDNTKKKLEKLFKYAEKNWVYSRTTNFRYTKNWYRSYAYETLKGKKGSCYGFAAAYGYLARKATGCQVRVAVGKTNGFSGKLQKHAWTEVKIGSKWYIFDTNLDKYAAKSKLKYCCKKRSSAKMKKAYNKYKGVKYATVK